MATENPTFVELYPTFLELTKKGWKFYWELYEPDPNWIRYRSIVVTPKGHQLKVSYWGANGKTSALKASLEAALEMEMLTMFADQPSDVEDVDPMKL